MWDLISRRLHVDDDVVKQTGGLDEQVEVVRFHLRFAGEAPESLFELPKGALDLAPGR